MCGYWILGIIGVVAVGFITLILYLDGKDMRRYDSTSERDS